MKTSLLPRLLGVFLGVSAFAAEPVTPETTYTWMDQNDPATAEITSLGTRYLDQVGANLVTEVTRTLAANGAGAAVDKLHLPNLTLPPAQPGKPHVTAVKRTSLYLRNPANAPDAADRAALDKIYFALRAGDAPPKLIFQKVETPGAATEWRLYRPVVTLPSCVQCHGPADQVSASVRVALQRRFPEDQAVGYAAGEWRGLLRVSIEAPAVAPVAAPAPAGK